MKTEGAKKHLPFSPSKVAGSHPDGQKWPIERDPVGKAGLDPEGQLSSGTEPAA